MSRDVATEPSTTVFIIPIKAKPPVMSPGSETVFAITEDCVEPTDGWVNREGKPLLTLCFMHSFGKCTGRKDSNPRTCSQIHLNPVVLNSLRRQYSNPTRKFFCRTVKATISQELRQHISFATRKPLKVQYLEYRVQDVHITLGFLRYEAAYREWLFSDRPPKKDASQTLCAELCSLFAQTNACPNENKCPFIHAVFKKALVRDRVLGQTLHKIFAPSESGSDISSAETRTSEYSDSKPQELTPEQLGLVFVFSQEEKKIMNFEWSKFSHPPHAVLPVPVYTVEQNDLSVTARLIPYTLDQASAERIAKE